MDFPVEDGSVTSVERDGREEKQGAQETIGRESLVRERTMRNTDVILVITNDLHMGETLVEALLHKTAYRPLLFSDSVLALRAMQAMKPLLCILDDFLSGTSSLAFYDRLQSMEELREIPVLMIGTALRADQDEIMVRGLIALSKPLDLDEFLKTIEEVVS
jgi:DNA-binding response OmpR family regulator